MPRIESNIQNAERGSFGNIGNGIEQNEFSSEKSRPQMAYKAAKSWSGRWSGNALGQGISATTAQIQGGLEQT
jgi:hypothetical protein